MLKYIGLKNPGNGNRFQPILEVGRILKKVFNNFWMHFIMLRSKEKRFYTGGTVRGVRISRLAEIPTLYYDLLKSLN